MIYFDNAATTFPKPESVYKSADFCTRYLCGNPGRSSHQLSAKAAGEIFSCREEIAEFFGGKPENVVFTLNATYALNIAINSLFRSGGEVLISGIEHNAVLRPVSALGCPYKVFNPLGSDEEIMMSLRSHVTPKTSLIVCNHVSNICGITLPIAKIGDFCEKNGIKFIVDASQSAGIKDIKINKCKADVICAPGHKGLYGLQGSGFALFADKYDNMSKQLNSFIYGGNGVNSLDVRMPDFLPEKFEAGTLPTPSISGLTQGIREVKKIGTEAIEEYESELSDRLKGMLYNIGNVTVYGGEYRGGTILFNINGIPSERVCEELDGFGICVRGGFHCCPLGHKLFKSGENGAVRVSFSVFNKPKEVNSFAGAILKIIKQEK